MRRWYEPTSKVEYMFDLEEVKAYHYHFHDNENDRDQIKENLLDFQQSIRYEPNEAKQYALLMAIYDDFILDGEKYENHVAVVLNDTEVVWFGPNEYNHGKKPYILTQYYPLPGSMYGMSAIQHSIPKSAAIDQMVFDTMQAVHIAANPIKLYDSKEEALQGDVPIQWNTNIPCKSPQTAMTILSLPMPNIQAVQYFVESMHQRIENETGATPVFSGENPDGSNVTAFQVNQHVQSGSVKQDTNAVKTFNNMGVEPFMRMVFENFQQFMTEPVNVPGFDKPLTPDLMKIMDFSFNLIGGNAAETAPAN